jgi:signal transduction histidine kinase
MEASLESDGSGQATAIAALELLIEVLTRTDSDAGSDAFYSYLAEAACEIAGWRRAMIFRYDDPTRRVRVAGGHGVDLARYVDAPVSVESAPISGRALAEDRVIEVRPPHDHGIAEPFAELVGDHPVVYVPISASGRWIGAILAEPLDDKEMDDGRRNALWLLGKILALVSIARIATFHGERARQLEERIDLARDIHEGVLQRLFGVSLALASDAPLDDETRKRSADEIHAALADLRTALQRPLGRSSRATGTTLAQEVERLAARHPDIGLEVKDGEVEVPELLEPLAQSVFREAVRNARKHAKAKSIVVSTRLHDGVFVLEIVNDGVRTRQVAGAPGVGLRLAALEAINLGGLVEFGQRGDDQWQLRLTVPEPREAMAGPAEGIA